MSYKPTPLACPTGKGAKKQEKEDLDYDGEEFDSQSEEDPNEVYMSSTVNNNQQAQQQAEALRLQQKEEELRHKASEANDDTWDTAEFYFNETIDLTDYVTEGAKGGITLKDGGRITLRVKDGSIQLGTLDKEGDFKVLKTAEALNADGKSMKNKKAMPLDSDIVKSAYLEDFKVDGWNECVIIRLNTIPKFREEGFYGASPHVCKMLMPRECKGTSEPIKIFDRKINKGMLSFQQRYLKVSPETLHKGIQKAVNGFCAVKFDSPIVEAINIDKMAHPEGETVVDGQYSAPSVPLTNQVHIPKDLVNIYTAKALKSMNHGVSYGNVTSDRFEIQFEADVPSHLRAKHDAFALNKATGRQFLYFADPYRHNPLALGAALNENIKTKSALFSAETSNSIRFQGKLVMRYKSRESLSA